jgi:hypothetical protein
VELARKVKFFGGNGSGTISSTIGSEVVQRDSATSAGEDEANEDGHDRTGPIPSQGRAMLRRRRQFDAQGNYEFGRIMIIKIMWIFLLQIALDRVVLI